MTLNPGDEMIWPCKNSIIIYIPMLYMLYYYGCIDKLFGHSGLLNFHMNNGKARWEVWSFRVIDDAREISYCAA